MNWGLENRLAQIFDPNTNRTVMLAIDHGYFQGPTRGLENPGETIEKLVQYCDALSPTKGVLQHCVNSKTQTPIILRASGGNSMARPKELDDEILTCSVEEAIKLNAVGVSVSIYVGAEHQKQTIENLAKMADEAHKYGLVVLGITATGAKLQEIKKPGKEEEFGRYLGLASRIAFEHGADIVKTYYVHGHFDKVIDGVHVPVVIAGGKKVHEHDALKFTCDAMDCGASGVDMGRNIFQSKYAVEMIQAVRELVHNNAVTVEHVIEKYKIPEGDHKIEKEE